jgi:glycosyltransferase involved in cell wall biosynthesis
MKRILVICPYPERVAPSQRLKFEQYYASWRAEGYQVTVSSFIKPPLMEVVYGKGRYVKKVVWTLLGYLVRVADLFRLPFYDGVYIHLWVVPFGPAVFEPLYCMLNRNAIYDIDDMVHLRIHEKVNANWFTYRFKSKSRVISLMRRARHVVTCTPALDEFVRRYNGNTTDISSTIDTDTYVPANPHRNNRPLVLGWSGSLSSSRYLYLLKDVLLDLSRELPFRLLVIGDPGFRIDGLDVTAVAWCEPTEVRDLQQIDIGLYPLPDDDWVQGKSGLKALQYMALGIPTVATAVGANFRVIEAGVSGLLVRTDAEWKDAITRLAADPALRERLGRNGRERVERLFSVRANAPTYLRVLDSVVGRDRPAPAALGPSSLDAATSPTDIP